MANDVFSSLELSFSKNSQVRPDTLEAWGWQGSPVTSEGSATSGQGLWLFCIELLWILRKGAPLGGCNTVQRQKGWQMDSWLYFIPPPPPQPLGSMSLCSKQPEPLYMVALNGKVLKAGDCSSCLGSWTASFRACPADRTSYSLSLLLSIILEPAQPFGKHGWEGTKGHRQKATVFQMSSMRQPLGQVLGI